VGPVEVLLDVAHNVESVSRLIQFMDGNPVSGRTFAVFGVMGDKPIRDMLAACSGAFDEWNLIDLSDVPRAMAVPDLANLLHPDSIVGDHGPFSDIWDSIKMRSHAGDRVVVFGSFFSVGEALSVLEAEYHSGEQG
jgi:dihydrofolate synthase/folylpolyglutamate synthase